MEYLWKYVEYIFEIFETLFFAYFFYELTKI